MKKKVLVPILCVGTAGVVAGITALVSKIRKPSTTTQESLYDLADVDKIVRKSTNCFKGDWRSSYTKQDDCILMRYESKNKDAKILAFVHNNHTDALVKYSAAFLKYRDSNTVYTETAETISRKGVQSRLLYAKTDKETLLCKNNLLIVASGPSTLTNQLYNELLFSH